MHDKVVFIHHFDSIDLILGELPDLSGYETILVGGPVWTGTVAPPVMRFLEQVGIEGKEVAAF